jgi:hypothetical protein
MATLVGEDGALRGSFDRSPRTRDLEERLKQVLERVLDLEDEVRTIRARLSEFEQARQTPQAA